MNHDRIIVNMACLDSYAFLDNGETEQAAQSRAEKYYKEDLALVESHLKVYGGDYWAHQVEVAKEKVKSGCKVMDFDEYLSLKRERILTGVVNEITEDEFNEQLNVLPPLHWTTRGNIEMFCMCEMLEYSYTAQYAYNLVNGKYYTATVDSMDSSTWIDRLIDSETAVIIPLGD